MQKIKGLESLSYREEQVFYLMAEGLENKAIGKKLGLSPATVNTYKATMYQKLDIHKHSELVIFYYKKLMEEKE